MAKKGLGRGLDLLIPKTTEPAVAPDTAEEPAVVADNNLTGGQKTEAPAKPAAVLNKAQAAVLTKSTGRTAEPAEGASENIVTLKISKVEPNRDQARKNFDDRALEELSESIKRYGVIQPIVVCKKGDYYEIIAGERRWRAAKKAGLSEIPVVIRQYEEKEKAEVSLIENIQRENLNPIEEAAAYKQLLDEYDLTQETLAERVSKSRTAIANTLRLLKLDEKVQQMVIDGKLSGGHARALLPIEGAAEQIKAANRVIDNNLNVRQTEELVRDMVKPEQKDTKKKRSAKTTAAAKEYKALESRMTEVLGTKVRVLPKEKGNGKIEINFYSEDELDRIYTCINSIQDS